MYLVGSFVLVSLAGCGRGLFQAEREPWRAEAEVACLKSGAVKEGPELVRIDPISGPGMCGAQFPLKVAAFGEASATFGYSDELRPPAISATSRAGRSRAAGACAYFYSDLMRFASRIIGHHPTDRFRCPRRASPPGKMKSSCPPRAGRASRLTRAHRPIRRATVIRPLVRLLIRSHHSPAQPLPRLGPARGDPVAAVGPVSVKPAATLACPIVSVLERWLADSVQPAATRWFGARVVEIKQISAYSCRGMNGNPTRTFPSTRSAMRSISPPSRSPTAAASRSRTAGGACRKSRGSCATCRPALASSSTPCWRRGRTAFTTITSTST